MIEYLVGGYGPGRGGHAAGIGRATRLRDGRLEFAGPVALVPSPSWVAVSGDVVHASLEDSAEVASFRIEDDTLRMVSQHATAGDGPCHMAVAGNALIVACYRSGSLGVHFLDQAGAAGELAQTLAAEGRGPLPSQGGPHAHHVLPLVDGRVLSLDLGTDTLHVHAWRDGLVTRIGSLALPPGTGPRDLRELPGGRLAVLGEWGCGIHLLAPDGDQFMLAASTTLHGATSGDQAAGLDLSRDGRFLYAGVRGADRVSVVAIDGDSLISIGSVPSGGAWPRHLVVDDDVLHVSNQRSNTVASFRPGSDGIPVAIGDPMPFPSPTQVLRIG